MGPRIDDRLADFGSELNHRLVHLRLDLLFEHDFSALEDFMNMGAQLARFRIDDGEFFFDTEREYVLLGAHQEQQTSVKNGRSEERRVGKECKSRWARDK